MPNVNPDTPEDEGTLISLDAESAFASLMDVLAPEEDVQAGDENGTPAAAPAAGDGSPAAPAEGAGAAGGQPAAPAAGTPGVPAVPAVPAPSLEATGVDASSFSDKWGEISTALEARTQEELEKESVLEVKTEYPKYFEALNKHPRTLVGEKVPSLTGKGEDVLRDSADAKEWQDAIKQQLWGEVTDRVSRKADDRKPMMETLHNSVALLRDNTDLIPGTKSFDKELADEFAALVKPYELRVEGKLSGYTIPVAPFLPQIRARLATARAAAAAAAPPAAPTAQQLRAAEQARTPAGQFVNPDAPQAGIPSRAGTSGDAEEDFSTLFGSIGLPGLRI